MKKILLFARDPGGGNALIPLYSHLCEKYQVLVFGKDIAWKRFRMAGIPAVDIDEMYDMTDLLSTHTFLKDQNPDILITGTSLNDYTERYLWKAAEKLNIKSFAIIDQWINLGIRFSPYSYEEEEQYLRKPIHSYLPYRILVMDEQAKKMLIEEGIDEEKIFISGQPHFDSIHKEYQKRKPILPADRWNMVYVSEPILQDYDKNDENNSYWGYNEITNFQALVECLEIILKQQQEKIRLIVRPHPREPKGKWDNLINRMTSENLEIICDTKNDSLSILKSVDVVCGMSSMFLLEAVICKKNVISIEIGLKRENPFILERIGFCQSILSKEDLLKELQKAHTNVETYKNRIFELVDHATERVLACIEMEMI